MSKPKAVVPLWTPAQVQANAALLDGSSSRVRLSAAVGDEGASRDEGTVGELWLYGVVGGWWRGFDAESVSRALRGMSVDTLYVRVHSPGGYAPDGIAIANLLRNHAAHVVVVVDGLAASAASVIALAGNEIVMCPGSQMMIHDCSTVEWGNAADLREAADWIDGQSENYAGVYAFKAGGTPAEWRQTMVANNGRGTWYAAQATVDAGLADRVDTITAVGSPPVAPEDDFEDEDFLARVAHDVALMEQYVHPAARAAWSGEPPKPPSASAVGSTHTEGGPAVTFSDEQLTAMRAKLELDETADEAAILAAVEAVVEDSLEDRDNQASSKVPKGMKLVSETIFEDVTAKAERGAQAAEALLKLQTDACLDKYKDRFPATAEAREKWAADFRRDPKGTEKYLASSAVLVHTVENGHAEDTETDAPTSLAVVQADPGYIDWKVS